MTTRDNPMGGNEMNERVWIVQACSGGRWRKVRGPEGGPWLTEQRALRIARGREQSPRRESSTEGLPHRVIPIERKVS